MKDFEINWKNLHYLIPIVILIVALAIGRTILGLSIFVVYFICQPKGGGNTRRFVLFPRNGENLYANGMVY